MYTHLFKNVRLKKKLQSFFIFKIVYTLCWLFLFLQKKRKRLQGKQENKNKIYPEKKKRELS